MSRVCQLEFSRRILKKGIQPEYMVKIMEKLPKGTTVIGFVEDLMTDSVYIRLENDRFKKVPFGTMFPGIGVTVQKDSNGDVEIDMNFTSVLESPKGRIIPAPTTFDNGTIIYTGTPGIAVGTPVYDDIVDEHDAYDLGNSRATTEPVAVECTHNWVWYNSIFSSAGDFEYCSECDVRKDEA